MPDNSDMSCDESNKFLILAGTNKSGTTAVFRYLGDHPSVSVSKQKESRFFYRVSKLATDESADLRAIYESQFLNARNRSNMVFVEASPQYLHGGHALATQIQTIVPDAKLMFILRNPTDRVVSYFRSSYGQPDVPTYGLTSDEFVEIALSAASRSPSPTESLSKRQRAFLQELRVCHYFDFLPAFIEAFGSENVLVTFFDQLLVSPHDLMLEICDFVDISSDFYENYTFRVENRTRNHRSVTLRQIAGRLNSSFEPMLNRFPAIRRGGRHIYDLLNVDNSRKVPFSSDAKDRLHRYFEPWNKSLFDLMVTTYPNKQLPDWLAF